jgi:hypothetical protein
MSTHFTRLASLCIATLALVAPVLAQPTPAANAGFDTYIHALETRLDQQHRTPDGFLAPVSIPQAATRLRNGEFLVENLTPPAGPELPGALLFHWRGSTFVAGASAADFERLLRDFNAYPKTFSPQVLQAAVLSQEGDHLRFRMRVRQHHVLTVVLDTTYDVTFRRLDPHRSYSLSRSTQISEIESAGTPSERTLSPAQAHGFMWRLNTYWTWEERDGGLYLQIESVSLTRSIPPGLGWMVRPFVESIPRESLEFTLRSAAEALGKKPVAHDASYTTDPKASR